MDDMERDRKQMLTRRFRQAVIAVGLAGTVGVTGLVGAQAAADQQSSDSANTTLDGSGSSQQLGDQSFQGWNVQPPTFGSGSGSAPHAQTGGS